MATNYIQEGKVLDYTATKEIKSGDVVFIGDMPGVALVDIPKGGVGAVQVEGVFDIPKAGTAMAQGVVAFWDDANKQVVGTDAENKRVGVVTAAAAAADSTVNVKLG